MNRFSGDFMCRNIRNGKRSTFFHLLTGMQDRAERPGRRGQVSGGTTPLRNMKQP